jgi:hypothetical protein
MPILTQKALVLAKVETTAGTDSIPTPALNAVLVSDPTFSVEAEEVTRNFARGDFSQYPSVYTQRRGQMTFTVEVRGRGTADLEPDWAVLLEGCGFSRNVVATATPADRDGIRYLPMTDSLRTLTLYMYFDGILHVMLGAMGTWSLTGEAGSIATVEFTFTGTYATPTQAAFPTNPVINNTVPPIVERAGLRWNADGNGLFAADFSIDISNEIALRRDVNSPQGLHSVYISGRNPTAGFTPEVSGALNDAFWADWQASTTRSMEVVVGGTGAYPGGSGAAVEGNSVIFTMPAVQITSIGYGDRDNFRTYDLGLALRRGAAGNDELAILFS